MITTTKATGIVARIMAILKLDDAGKIQSFFDREIKKLKRNILTLQKNIENLKFNNERVLDGLREDLEDAELALESAYEAVNLADVESNAKQENYSHDYWKGIDNATTKVEAIKSQIKNQNEGLAEDIKECERQIAEIQFRVNKIS